MSAVARDAVADTRAAATPAARVKDEAGLGYWVATGVLMFVAWELGDTGLYTAGSKIGYNLGLAGGSLMLLLLLYPLRKRVRFMHSWIPLKHWFKAHMFLGVAGPILVIFHCHFRFGSLNGGVAFFSMMAVFLSGLVGRFIYTKIHSGLYGRKSTLADLRAQLGTSVEQMHENFHSSPALEARLSRFEAGSLSDSAGYLATLIRLLMLGLRSSWLYFMASRDLKREVRRLANVHGWGAAERQRRVRYGKSMIRQYLTVVRSVLHFTAYERMFSLWHLLHVPLMFILVISGVIHVLAVHMY